MDENTCSVCGTTTDKLHYYYTHNHDGSQTYFCANCIGHKFTRDYTEGGVLCNALVTAVLLGTFGETDHSADSLLTQAVINAVLADRQMILNAVAEFNNETWNRSHGTLPSPRNMILNLFAQKQPKKGITAIDATRELYIRMNTGLGRLMLSICHAKGDQTITLVTSDDPQAMDQNLELQSVYGTVDQMLELLTLFADSYTNRGLVFTGGGGLGRNVVARIIEHIRTVLNAISG